MSVLFVVVPIAVLMSAGAVATFFWAVRRGQFDDLTTPSLRILHDELDGPDRTANSRAAEAPQDQTHA